MLPEEIDVSQKAVIVNAKTDTPEVLEGFYFRAYNEGEDAPALSFVSWKKPIISEYADVTMIPEEDGVMRWEPDYVSGTQPTNVKMLRIDVGTGLENEKVDITIKGIRFVDHPYALLDEALKPFCQYIGIGWIYLEPWMRQEQ